MTTPSLVQMGRSLFAVLVGFAVVVVLSITTDLVFQTIKVLPPDGQTMYQLGLNALALAYRSLYTVVGGYICAALAPQSPRGHALVLGIIGTAAGTAGVFATWNMGLGPHWYPIALALGGLPLSWLGGALRR